MSQPINRQVLLVRRPNGTPGHEDFRLADAPVPLAEPGEMLLRNLYLSLDPYMRGRMEPPARARSARRMPSSGERQAIAVPAFKAPRAPAM